MARPLSEDKPVAVLRAACEVIAEAGLGAPTSQIARRAGVAEGTLFRYFPTKDELFSRLFDFLIEELEREVMTGLSGGESTKTHTQILWNNFIDWGLTHPAAYVTLNQLSVSGKVSAAQQERAGQMCAHVGDASTWTLMDGLTQEQGSQFTDALFTAIANTTIGFVTSNPELAKAYKNAGFAVLWRALNANLAGVA